MESGMKKEYDFSKGERGKFYRPDLELNIPIYLDRDVAEVMRQRARKSNSAVGTIVNRWLRADIRAARKSGEAGSR
jgi:hypothetical protein